jgi:hypothetical protein
MASRIADRRARQLALLAEVEPPIAAELQLAAQIATVSWDHVAIVTLFRRLHDAIAAQPADALARSTANLGLRRLTLLPHVEPAIAAGFDLAARRATVTIDHVAVIALLASTHEPVSAALEPGIAARIAHGGVGWLTVLAGIQPTVAADLQLAAAAATVRIEGVAVVALFRALSNPVAAYAATRAGRNRLTTHVAGIGVGRFARLTGIHAPVTAKLDQAVGAAAVPAQLIAVLALFARLLNAVAAGSVRHQLAAGRALRGARRLAVLAHVDAAIATSLAQAVSAAAIAAHGVAVFTLLERVQNAVAATPGDAPALGIATRSARRFTLLAGTYDVITAGAC